MAVLVLVKGKYRNTDSIDNLINYVLNAEKMPNNCYGGNGISLLAPAESMNKIKEIYDKTTGKQAEHFILAFSKNEQANLSIQLLSKIAYDICSFFEGIQILFAVHEVKNTYFSDYFDNDSIHIHFVVNTVNLITGQKFIINYNNEFDLRNYIEALLVEYDVSENVNIAVSHPDKN